MNRITIEDVSVEKVRRSKVGVEGQMLGDVSAEVLIQKALEYVVPSTNNNMQSLQVLVQEDEEE